MRLLFKVLSFLPLVVLHGLGWALGWCAFLLSPTYRRRVLANAAQADVPVRLALASVGAAGQMVAELPRLWLGAKVAIVWEGAEAVEQAQARRKGIIFLTPHLGCFEIAARAYAERFGQQGQPATVLFRPPRMVSLQPLVEASRVRPGLQVAPTTMAGVKQLVRALKKGEAIGLLPDQVPPLGLGEWVPFFGKDAYTMTLSVRLAAQTGAQVLFIWGERLSWGRGYRVHVQAASEPWAQDTQTALLQMNQMMERMVLNAPAQYLWGYGRYKAPRQE